MTATRSQALLGYLACGWPEPDPRLIPYAQAAVDFGMNVAARSAWAVDHDWRTQWRAIAPDNSAELALASGLLDVRLTRKVATAQTFPSAGEYLTAMLGEVLVPVAVHAFLEAEGCLDEDAVARAAKRTQKALAAGKGTAIVSRCTSHVRR